MARKGITDEQVEIEIARLNQTEQVRLARKKYAVQYRRRQYMYKLRNMYKEGEQLMGAGITMEMLEGMDVDELDSLI